MSHGMIVEKDGKFYVFSRQNLRKLAMKYAEAYGRKIPKSEIKNLKLVEE